jgi:processive 1,2-diacylglycerol beta-glucosyltransferase
MVTHLEQEGIRKGDDDTIPVAHRRVRLKSIVILTSRGGNGLVAASEALASAMDDVSSSVAANIVDLPHEISSPTRFLTSELYNRLLRRDLGLCALYVRVSEWSRYHSWGHMMEDFSSIRKCVMGMEPHAVVVVSPWILSAVTCALRDEAIPVFSVVVDLGKRLPLGWVCNDVTKGIVPTEEAWSYLVERGMDPRNMVMGGVLVHPRYLKTSFNGYEPGSVLLLAGHEGTWNSLHLAKALLRTPTVSRLDVLCGRNEALLGKLRAIADPRLRSHGYVRDLLPFYLASQVVVSKCGALTLAECIAVGKPLVVDGTRGIMPQELGNVELVLNQGLGYVARTQEEVMGRTVGLLKDDGRYDGIMEGMTRARKLLRPHRVAEAVLERC